MRVFFATDIHGSEVCWRKFLNAAAFYKADLVVLGGDVTGKVMVPIVAHNGYWQVVVRGETIRMETKAGARGGPSSRSATPGSYPAIVSPDELQDLSEEEGAVDRRFSAEMTPSLDRWLDMADGKLRGGEIPCILNGGNDDIWEIDDIIEASPSVTFGEGKVARPRRLPPGLDGLDQPHAVEHIPRGAGGGARGQDRGGRRARCRTWSGRSSTSTRRPTGPAWTRRPRSTTTLRPMHGGAVMKPVGSTAVRDAIVSYQPMLSVHGHIHESRGIKKMGRTLAINPGSVYGDGVLQGAVLELNAKKGKVTKYLLVNG